SRHCAPRVRRSCPTRRASDLKTGALTECACRLGALIGEADEEVVEALSRYGRLVGRAFQITDDLLDVCGHQRLAGKTLGSDLRRSEEHTSELQSRENLVCRLL